MQNSFDEKKDRRITRLSCLSTAAAALADATPGPKDLISYARELENYACAWPEAALPVEQAPLAIAPPPPPVLHAVPKADTPSNGKFTMIGRVDSTKRDHTAFKLQNQWYQVEAEKCPKWKSQVRVQFELGPKGSRRALSVEAA